MSGLHGHTILLLEDSPVDANWIMARVRSLGASVRLCKSVEEAQTFANRFDWSGFLIDMEVPLSPGEQPAADGGAVFVRWLRGKARYSDTPAILVSGLLTNKEQVPRAFHLGFTDVNFKDTSPSDPAVRLSEQLESFVSGRPLPDNSFEGGAVVRRIHLVGSKKGRRRLLIVNPDENGEGTEVYAPPQMFATFMVFAAHAAYHKDSLVAKSQLPVRFKQYLSELVVLFNEAGFEVVDGSLFSIGDHQCRRLEARVTFDFARLHAVPQWAAVRAYARGR